MDDLASQRRPSPKKIGSNPLLPKEDPDAYDLN